MSEILQLIGLCAVLAAACYVVYFLLKRGWGQVLAWKNARMAGAEMKAQQVLEMASLPARVAAMEKMFGTPLAKPAPSKPIQPQAPQGQAAPPPNPPA